MKKIGKVVVVLMLLLASSNMAGQGLPPPPPPPPGLPLGIGEYFFLIVALVFAIREIRKVKDV